MSQSPVEDLSEQATLRYKQGWRALNRLLHEDRAFSGKERNCAFLNLGGPAPSFATVSAVTGFDFPDDGRGLATVDWDFDGDLDVWLSNRTAPRLRFLKNQTPAQPFVAVKLLGDGRRSNRDAIGARIEWHLRGVTGSPERLRTVRGGEGFLSQSSAWNHLGLGPATGIEKLVVRWPDGSVDEWSGVEPGKFYLARQGVADLSVFSAPTDRAELAPSTPALSQVGDAVRIVVPPGLPLPPLGVVADDGAAKAWSPPPGRPTLINLWATWCHPCLNELSAWASERDALQAAGLDVVLFNTDGLGNEESKDKTAVESVLAKTGASFAHHRIALSGLHALDHLNRSVLDRWQPLPLPTSFLIDAQGELAVIYKGPVAPAQLIADLSVAAGNAEARRAAATPFPGRWVDAAGPVADPKRVASLMLDHDDASSAIAYLDRCLQLMARKPTTAASQRQMADLQYMAGLLKRGDARGPADAVAALAAARDLDPHDLRVRRELAQALFAAGRSEEAATELRAALRINPADVNVKNELADLNLRLGNLDQARSLLEEIVAAQPKDGLTRYRLAGVLDQAGEARAAIDAYRQTLRDSPRLVEAANDLARLLATHPDPAIRSAQEAKALAQRLCAISQEKDARFLETLGLALANNQEFPAAIDAATKAIQLLPAENTTARTTLQSHIDAYSRQEPVRR